MKSSSEGSQIHYSACQLAAVSCCLCPLASLRNKGVCLYNINVRVFSCVHVTGLECESEWFWPLVVVCSSCCQSTLQNKVAADGQGRDRMLGPEGPIGHWTRPRKSMEYSSNVKRTIYEFWSSLLLVLITFIPQVNCLDL